MTLLLYVASALATLLAANRVRRMTTGAMLALLLLPVVLTGRALVTGGVYGPLDIAYTSEPLASTPQAIDAASVANPSVSDVYAEFFPWRDALRRAIAARQWPLWNPYALCGTPLAGAAQVAPYHPFTIAALLLPLASSFAYSAAMLYFIAALGAFLLAREFCTGETGPLFGATAWMASTHLVFFAGTALGNAISLAPLVLFGARRVVIAPGRASQLLLLVALLLVVLSGHPETLLHVVFLGACYFAFELAISRSRRVLVVIGSGVKAGIGALLISAIFLLPHLEAIPQSTEYAFRETVRFQRPLNMRLTMHVLRANFFPFLEGAPGVEERRHRRSVQHGWLPTAYAGTLVFAPAWLGLRRARQTSRWFFAAMVVWGFAAAVSAPGLVHLFNRLPAFSIAANDRMIAFAVLGLAMLSAIGIDMIDRDMAGPLLAVTFVLVMAALVPSGVSSDYLRVAALRAIVPVALAVATVWSLSPRAAAIALLGLLLLQRSGETVWMQRTMPAAMFYPPFPGRELLHATQPFRVVAIDTMLPPEISTHYGLEDVRGFEALTFARYDKLIPMWSTPQPVWSSRVDTLESPLLSMMNVRYAFALPDRAVPAGWAVRLTTGGYSIVENVRALPRAFVPRQVEYVGASNGASRVGSIPDFGEISTIETPPFGLVLPNGPGNVEVSENGSRLSLRADMERGGYIVVSNAAWNGWRASLDGKPVGIRFANHAFIGIYVPAGRHTIDLFYMPRSFVIGAIISVIGSIVIVAIEFRRAALRPAPGATH